MGLGAWEHYRLHQFDFWKYNVTCMSVKIDYLYGCHNIENSNCNWGLSVYVQYLVCVSVRSGVYLIGIGDFCKNWFLGITKVFPAQNSFQLTGDLVKSPVNFQVPSSWVIFLMRVPSSLQKHTHPRGLGQVPSSFSGPQFLGHFPNVSPQFPA